MPLANWEHTTTAEETADYYAGKVPGKTIFVSGVSPGGIGAYFVKLVAKYQPRLLILAGRNLSKVEETKKDVLSISSSIKVRTIQLDLSSQEQIREAAKVVNSYAENIDILINSAAGIASDYGTTKDGIESQFGTNYLGPFLFTNLIMNKILVSEGGGRIVSVGSAGHRWSPIRFDDWSFDNGRTYNKYRAYGQSKTATILFPVALAERLRERGLSAFSVHPGGILQTNLAAEMSQEDWENIRALDTEMGNKEAKAGGRLKTLTQGASTYFVAAFDDDIRARNGSYLLDCQIATESDVKPYALDEEAARKLWILSEKILGQDFMY